MSELKQMIVMRKDLGMRAGKMVAQGAHASLAATLEYLSDPRVEEWLQGSFTKVCVRVESEEELIGLWDKAIKAGIPNSLITDNGLTEFHGVLTTTCCAIGPATADQLAPITGELKLL
ncbi:aminoacyl-tRNA hydrolase [Mycobacteroides abscessus]|uniref:aminoacyl-tRNA hydrolase n=1 Tax=Mycobacteroides abscessus TaxID=36809 RepID=UPI00232B5D61|nr:aminoacyl-tRNA hydrolase [Mycobacteroides abscessus]MDB2213918.1 aminoacyl-tRNA hydrolase [Mycobacteroides abscessus subsp. massiliense]WJJ55517.1 peptidyl tRNA hydrolase [Mycobacterium phage prophiT49-2]